MGKLEDALDRGYNPEPSDMLPPAAHLELAADDPWAVALAASVEEARRLTCHCPPCPGRGDDGHGMTHCAECCFGSGVEVEPGCPVHHPIQHGCGVEDCGQRRCDGCDERLMCTGPEPRACGTTCVECRCDCSACLGQREDMRADLLHTIEGESR